MKINMDKAIEKYSEKILLRSAISAIPYIGNSIDIILSSRGATIIQNRILAYIEALKNQLNDLSSENVFKDYLNSEDFFDLIVKSFDIASKTSGENKIKLLSSIVKHSIKKPSNKINEDLLYIIENLNENDIVYMLFLNDNIPNPPKEKIRVSGLKARELHKVYPDESEDVHLFNLMKLEKLGLLHRNPSVVTEMEGIPYNPTKYFEVLLQYLKNI
jgi:hypothetical protein